MRVACALVTHLRAKAEMRRRPHLEDGAALIVVVEERERHGPYVTAGDLVRRTGLKPQAVLSLTMAGAFDGITPSRREALWEAGLHPHPTRNGQAPLPISTEDSVPRLQDFTKREKMMGEYR